MTTAEQVRVIPAARRWHWRNEWLTSRQSFPATGDFALDEHAHGVLFIHNEDTVAPGEGFDTHQHRDMEILTWVLEGTVVHQDSVGHAGMIHPGLAQRMSAGRGIRHSERNGAGYTERAWLHVVQMWVPPDIAGVEPSYQEADVTEALRGNHLVTVASGMPRRRAEAAIGLGNTHASFHVARLDAGAAIEIPASAHGHVFVARGAVDFEGTGTLDQGDAVRLTSSGGQRVRATEPAEVLVWEMDAAARS